MPDTSASIFYINYYNLGTKRCLLTKLLLKLLSDQNFRKIGQGVHEL